MATPARTQVVAAVERLGEAHRRSTGELAPPAQLLPSVYQALFQAVAADRGAIVTPAADPGLVALLAPAEDTGDDAAALGALHEHVLTLRTAVDAAEYVLEPGASDRRRAGAWFTPPDLVAWLLDEALDPALDAAGDPAAVAVLDPACGAGAFLLAAGRRIARRLRGPAAAERALRCLHGIDTDPAAVELARVCLGLEVLVPGRPAALPPVHLRVADALLADGLDGRFDVVVGNPPFLGALRTLTAATRPYAGRLRAAGVPTQPYTDRSAVFLERALGWVRPGGRVALVQPLSVVAARDAARVRREVAARASLDAFWATPRPVFDAAVLTCAPVLTRDGRQAPVRRSWGPRFTPLPGRAVSSDELEGEWGFLLAAGLGVPEVRLAGDGTVGDLARCTADFRDQYYGLAGHVREARPAEDEGLPLTHVERGAAAVVTTGLVEPAEVLWGRRPARLHRRRWSRPVVEPDVLDPATAAWARSRLVPKVLVGTQGRVVEAVADEDGRWLPSVPVISVVPLAGSGRDRLWHLLAVLLAPPVSAAALTRYAGAALSAGSVKLSAAQVAALPLPGAAGAAGAWDAAAEAVRRAQHRADGRDEALEEAGRLMCRAYGVAEDPVVAWWLARVRARPGSPRPRSCPADER